MEPASTVVLNARVAMPWKIFFSSLVLRWAYVILMFGLMGDAGLQSEDSQTYLFYAHEFARQIDSGLLHGWQWLGPISDAMPLAHWLFSLCALLFGASAALGYVLLQGVMDAGTCVFIYVIARELDESYAVPASVAAAVNPTQIVLCGLALTDTPFVFFISVLLFATIKWLHGPDWRWALLMGLSLGAATLIRALSAPFTAVLLLFLVAIAIFKRSLPQGLFGQLAAVAAIVSLCIAPVIWRNVDEYGAWSLTPQGGIHLALWVVPLVKEAADGTPWRRTYDDMQHRVDERYPTPTTNPFEQSRRYEDVAKPELKNLGIGAITRAWLVGAAINFASPAIILSPPIFNLPRTGFYATPGTSPFDKIENFLFHSKNVTYTWILLTGIVGVAVVRFIQLIGVVILLGQRKHWPILIMFALWIAYVLAVNGPVASPKYRLPIEPPLMVFAGVGLSALLRRSFDHDQHAKPA